MSPSKPAKTTEIITLESDETQCVIIATGVQLLHNNHYYCATLL